MVLSFSSLDSNSALLNAVSMLWLLGITSSFLSLPRSTLEDQMPAGFRGRALLAVEGDKSLVEVTRVSFIVELDLIHLRGFSFALGFNAFVFFSPLQQRKL